MESCLQGGLRCSRMSPNEGNAANEAREIVTELFSLVRTVLATMWLVGKDSFEL